MSEEMNDAAMDARQQKYGHIGRVAKNDPECVENECEFAGMLVNVFRRNRKRSRTTIFGITCGHPGMKMDENGRYRRDYISVEFDDDEGDYYAEKFHQGDFVVIKAVAQTLTNTRNGRRSTIFVGQSIEDGRKNVLARDTNKVKLTGRVVSAEQENDSWVSMLIQTKIWKSRYNFRTGRNDAEDYYRSITRIRVYTGAGNAQTVADYRLTKGTIVTVYGRVYGRSEPDRETGNLRHVATIIATDIKVVGDIQPPEKSPVSSVYHPENAGEEDAVEGTDSTTDNEKA